MMNFIGNYKDSWKIEQNVKIKYHSSTFIFLVYYKVYSKYYIKMMFSYQKNQLIVKKNTYDMRQKYAFFVFYCN